MSGIVSQSAQSFFILATAPPPPKDLFVPVPFATASGGDADLYLAPKYYGAVFASDVPAPIASVMAITQRPIANSAHPGATVDAIVAGSS